MFPDGYARARVSSGSDGAETYGQLVGIRPGQPAIIFSGFAESPRVAAAQTLGAGAYVRKPVTWETLAGAVREELGGPRSQEQTGRRTLSRGHTP